MTTLDKPKLELIQKIVDMSTSGMSDLKISQKTGSKIDYVMYIRKFFGIMKRKIGIDIRNDYKMVKDQNGNLGIYFGLKPLILDFNLKPKIPYKFKAISTNNEKRQITLSIVEA